MPPAAIKARFYTWRPAMASKMLQLIFEVPLAEQAAVLEYLGAPNPEAPTEFGIAKLTPRSAEQTQGDITQPAGRALSPKDRYAGLQQGEKAVVRAGMLSGDRAFQEWMHRRDGVQPPMYPCTEHGAAVFIRHQCEILSRSEIGTDQAAFDKFLALETEYLMATGKMASPS